MNPETYIQNKLKPPKAFHEWCMNNIPVYEWENKEKRITSANRKSKLAIKKRLTKKSVLNTNWKLNSFAIILVTKKRIEIQSYAYWHCLEKGKELIDIELVNMEVFIGDKHLTFGKYYDRWSTGLVNNFNHLGGPYAGTAFYNNGWKDKVSSISELRYIDFSKFELWRSDIARLYKYRYEIEYLQKIKANKMAEEVMYRCGVDMRTINKKWLKDNKPFIRDSDVSFEEYELEQRIRKRNGKVVDGIHAFLNYRDINKIPKNVGIIRFQNWVIKNKVKMKYYYDYLSILNDLDIVPDTENLIIPKDLTKAHDNAVKLLNQKKRDIELKEFEERKELLKRMDMKLNGYMFIVPEKANELINEGKQLSHCVGGSKYVKDHASGKTTIVFVRNEKEPEKSLYTMEYKSKKIVQCRGKRNESAPDDVMDVIHEWKNIIEKNRGGKQCSI